MKIFNKNRIIPLIMALIMLMVLTFNSACSTFNTKDITTSAKEADTYIRVRINLPHKRIYNFTVHENYLYYICYEEPDDTAYEIPYMGRNPNELQALLVRLNLDNPDSFTITPLDVPADQYIQTVAVDNDGYIHILTSQCIEEDTYVSYGNMFWYKIDSEDSISKIVEYSIDDYLLPTQLIIGNDGNAYISAFCTYEESIILVINPSGDLIAKFPEYSLFMFKDDEGNVYTHHYTTFIALHGFTTMVVSLIDLETANLVEIIDITKLAGVRAGFTGLGKKAEVFFLANTDGIYSYSMESQTKIEHYTWDEIGMGRISNDARVFPIDNQILFVDIPEGRGGGALFEGNTFSIIRPQTSEDIARMEAEAREWEALLATGRVGEITLGAVGRSISPAINQAISDFNFQHPYSQIRVKQYGTTFGNDFSEGLNQLNTDIISGRCPDILLLPQNLSLSAYITQGVFQDLYPFIEADTSFDIADYQENIIKAYEFGGGLFGIPISFFIDTVYGKASHLEGRTSWNLAEFIEFCEQFPDSMIFHHPTKTAVLDVLLKANGGNMVNWSNGDFDREMLFTMLEFAGRFVDTERHSDERMVMERIEAGDIHLMTGYASPGQQYEMAIFGEPIRQIGFPDETGNGLLIVADSAAISSSCQHTDTAWQFIKLLLSDEVQNNPYLHGYQIKRSSMERQIEASQKARGEAGATGDGINVQYELHGTSDEEVRIFREILNTASRIRMFDYQIDMIIKEEAGAYFSGSKPLDVVADIIENRVQVYVKESR